MTLKYIILINYCFYIIDLNKNELKTTTSKAEKQSMGDY